MQATKYYSEAGENVGVCDWKSRVRINSVLVYDTLQGQIRIFSSKFLGFALVFPVGLIFVFYT